MRFIASSPRRLNVIEAALVALSKVCDGAHSHDNTGFNGTDTQYGKSLAKQIEAGRYLTYKQAHSAIKLLPKYKKQLTAMGLTVPSKKDFFELYETPKRVEIIDNEIAIFAPSADQVTADQTIYYSNDQALSRYEPHDQSLRFPKTSENVETILEVLAADYELSVDFRLLAAAVTQNESKQMKRIDLLSDEHPDRCVAVYFPRHPNFYIDPDFLPHMEKITKLRLTYEQAVYLAADDSWRFPLAAINDLQLAFPTPDYHHSKSFLKEFDLIDCGF
jgi:hypothetical protein